MIASFVCLEATACGVSRPADRVVLRQIRLSTEDWCHFGFSTHLAQCSFGRFPARFAIAAGTDAAGPSCSLGCRVMRLRIVERSGAGDTSSSPWRRSGAIISFMLSSLRTHGPFDVGSPQDAVALLPGLIP